MVGLDAPGFGESPADVEAGSDEAVAGLIGRFEEEGVRRPLPDAMRQGIRAGFPSGRRSLDAGREPAGTGPAVAEAVAGWLRE